MIYYLGETQMMNARPFFPTRTCWYRVKALSLPMGLRMSL
jgi:hypothetical protein